MQEREQRRAILRAELAALERETVVRRGDGDVAAAFDVMRQALGEWQATLRAEPPAARTAVQALLRERLVFSPNGAGYHFKGPGTIAPIIADAARAFAKGVVAPTGFEAVDESGPVFATVLSSFGISCSDQIGADRNTRQGAALESARRGPIRQ